MKIKQFFIDNKSKIKKVLEWFLTFILFFVGSHLIYACGYYTRDQLDTSEESIKKELVIKREAYTDNLSTGNLTFQIGTMAPYNRVTQYFEFYYNINYILFEADSSSIEININYDLITRVKYVDNISYDYWARLNPVERDAYFTIESQVISDNSQIESLSIGFNITQIQYEGGYSDGDSYFDLGIYQDVSLKINNIESEETSFLLNDSTSFSIDGYNLPVSIQQSISSILFDIDDVGYITDERRNSFIFNTIYAGYNEGFDVGYEAGYQSGLPKNIFYYNVEKDSPILLVLDDTSWVRPVEPDDYDENLLFKNNYLDLQYLRDLYSGQYSKFRVIFTDSLYSLKDLYLSLDNSSLNDYNILVNGKAYTINSSGTLNIPSSELLQAMEFDSSLLDSTRLINSSPDYANGFNNGYQNGYDNGYDEAEIDQEDYYEELIIPAVKVEYEEIGYDKGYIAGKNDALNSGTGLAVFDAFSLIGKGFEVWNPILDIQVLPGMSLGVFIAIPIVIAVVLIVIKLLQR